MHPERLAQLTPANPELAGNTVVAPMRRLSLMGRLPIKLRHPAQAVVVGLVSVLIAAIGMMEAIDQLSWQTTSGVIFDDLGDERAMVRFSDERERIWEVAVNWRGAEDQLVRVWYDPNEPSSATLYPNEDAGLGVVAATIFLTLGLVAIFDLGRSRPEQPPDRA